MKNTIVINAMNGSSTCELLSTVDSGENSLLLEIRSDLSNNPKIEIGEEEIKITGSPFLCEIGKLYYNGTGDLKFNVVDDTYIGEQFKIRKVQEEGGNLFLNRLDATSFELLYIPEKNETGVPIATDVSLGVVKGGENIGVRPNGTMWFNGQGIEEITNEELDEICKI